MINWDELKHIHVIRKLEEILSSWFSTAILMTDNHGNIRNFERNKNQHSNNQLCQLLLERNDGFEFLEKHAAKICNDLKNHKEKLFTTEGPFPNTQAICAKIDIEQEFQGMVMAWPYMPHEPTENDKQSIKQFAKTIGLNESDVAKAVEQLHTVNDGDLSYLKELVELVAKEIETFHMEITTREERINALNKELGTRYRYDAMIGKSKPMQSLYLLLDKIKNSESTVLIQGENGTGKELIAKAVHYNSPRKDTPLLTVNCSAFNENLLDSELFGHIRGAFTGAVKDKKGLFEAAHKGTLFLDEIGDMNLTMQVKLLRVLQEGTILPVGSTSPKQVDVRVILATNKDLKAMVEEGTFREDLYYRINVINVNVPPLRERKEDIPLLVDFFLDKGCKEKGLTKKRLAKRTMEKIFDYSWPGNIRELGNEVERIVVLAGNDARIPVELLSPRIKEFGEHTKVQGVRVAGKLKDALEELEKTMIREGLKRTNWNKSRLAKELGISRAGLIMKVDKYQLDKRKILAETDTPKKIAG